MAIFENILLAIESLRMNRMRAILTMLGIIIGIGSVIAISTVGSSLTGSVTDSMSSLGATSITVSVTEKSDDTESDTESDVKLKMFASSTPSESDLISDEMINEYKNAFPDDVKYVEMTSTVGTSSVTDYDDSTSSTSLNVIGVNDDYESAEEINMLSGRFVKNEKDSDKKLAVCSDKFVEDCLGLTSMNAVGQSFTMTLNNMPYTYYIVGVYEYEETTTSTNESTTVTTNLYIPDATARTLTGVSSGYESITVMTSAQTDTSTFMTTTGDFFASYYNQNDTFTAEASSLEEVLSTVTDIINTISYAIAAIAAISLLVGGIGVMNIMLVSITERTKEIGTRKAIGAPNSSIRLQFITESVVICLIGGIIGIVLGLSLGAGISSLLGYSATPSVSTIIIAVGFSMLVGVIFGYAPANKAAKLDPIDALRYE